MIPVETAAPLVTNTEFLPCGDLGAEWVGPRGKKLRTVVDRQVGPAPGGRPPAEAPAFFQDEHFVSSVAQGGGRGESGNSRAEDDIVMDHNA